MELIRMPDFVRVESADGWSNTNEIGNSWRAGNGVQVDIQIGDGRSAIYLMSPMQPVKRLHLRWAGKPADRPVRLLGDHWERSYGDLEWRGIVAERVMPWYFLVNGERGTFGYGVMTGANALCWWMVDNAGVSLYLDVRNGGQGVKLGERSLKVADISGYRGSEEESAYSCARNLCRILCPNPALPQYPVYGGNNWYYAYGESSHARMLEDSRFMAGLSDHPNRPFMVIDDGWQLSGGGMYCNGGPWVGNADHPDMSKLAAQMKEAGVRPGVWFRPLLTTEKVPAGWKRLFANGVTTLDPSVPEVLEYVADAIRAMRSWGFELIKHDFSTFDLLGQWGHQAKMNISAMQTGFVDDSRTTAEIMNRFYSTIADASEDTLIIGCNTVGHLAAGKFEIQRTGDDTSGRNWERTRRMGVNTLAFRMPQHGTFFACDADCVGLTPDIPWYYNQQWLELLANSGTPLFVSADPGSVGPEQLQELKKAFSQAATRLKEAEPLDWLDNACPTEWQLEDRKVQYDWYGLEGVRLYGTSDEVWWK